MRPFLQNEIEAGLEKVEEGSSHTFSGKAMQ
jgi:hypothetical protein